MAVVEAAIAWHADPRRNAPDLHLAVDRIVGPPR
jgi:hypothetical protein